MHRFYLPPDACRQDPLVLSGREAHHALHVLRLRRQDRITVLDGAGTAVEGEIIETGREQVVLKVLRKETFPARPWQLTLFQAPPKGKTFETIIQKATELGVSRIVPVLTERVVAQVAPGEASHKADKWTVFAVEAIKQCGWPWLPEVLPPMPLEECLANLPAAELSLVASLQGEARHAREYFDRFEAQHRRKPESVAIWIGPEGDFTAEEVGRIRGAGALPITLGPTVLRADTAAICALSIVSYELAASGRGRP